MQARSWSLSQLAAAVLVYCIPAVAGEVVVAGEVDAAVKEVKTLVQSQELDAAFDRTQEISDARLRDQALRFVAKSQFAKGDYVAAITSSAYITDDTARDRALRGFAESVAAAHRSRATTGNAGGGAAADFDTLIELIQTTVKPDTWEELGGPGTAAGFPGGVLVDTEGVVTRVLRTPERSRTSADNRNGDALDDIDVASRGLRKISLRRLEKQLQRLAALGRTADEAMRNLAGLYRVKYVTVTDAGTPTADIILAGFGGEWTIDDEQRTVNVQTGRPIIQLDDLVVMLRNTFAGEGVFGCSITPRQASLASAQKYLDVTSDKPLEPGQREAWLDGLRDQLGEQDITVHGVEPGSRVARVIVEADYRMKLVGMGLEPGVPGVDSYLDRVTVGRESPIQPMSVLRWWFALSKETIDTNTRRDVFALPKQSVCVLSENELLTETGQRVHTGKSDEFNAAFARDFTAHFDKLADKYPIYAELQNVFDLALVAAVLKAEELPAQAGWQMTFFNPQGANWLSYRPAVGETPRTVQTVLSHRILGKKHIVAGVSGGVHFQTRKDAITGVEARMDSSQFSVNRPADPAVWWWE